MQDLPETAQAAIVEEASRRLRFHVPVTPALVEAIAAILREELPNISNARSVIDACHILDELNKALLEQTPVPAKGED